MLKDEADLPAVGDQRRPRGAGQLAAVDQDAPGL